MPRKQAGGAAVPRAGDDVPSLCQTATFLHRSCDSLQAMGSAIQPLSPPHMQMHAHLSLTPLTQDQASGRLQRQLCVWCGRQESAASWWQRFSKPLHQLQGASRIRTLRLSAPPRSKLECGDFPTLETQFRLPQGAHPCWLTIINMDAKVCLPAGEDDAVMPMVSSALTRPTPPSAHMPSGAASLAALTLNFENKGAPRERNAEPTVWSLQVIAGTEACMLRVLHAVQHLGTACVTQVCL